MTGTRQQVIDDVVEVVTQHRLGHPLRVLVDGITASGKSTIAGELASGLTSRRPTIQLSMDGYHNPKSIRYRKGRMSADGYYEDAYDFDGFAGMVLRPLGSPGSGQFVPAIFDLSADSPIQAQPRELPEDGVLVVDGSFLQRPETQDLWDVVVFVDTPFDLARHRGAKRDATQLGGYDEAGHIFDVRYHAAARRYLTEVRPRDRAHLIIDNTDLAVPILHRGNPLSDDASDGSAT